MDTYLIILIVLIALLGIAILLAVFSPRLFVRGLFRPVLATLYRKRVVGLDKFPAEGGCLLVSNHMSWIDGILILWALPRNVRFVVDGTNFTSKIGDYLGRAFDTIFMMGGPKSIGRAIRDAREGLNNGDVIGIFPEGTITRTGQLQAFRPGMSKMLKNTNAKIVPIHLEGMWGSIFSFSGGKYFWKWPDRLRRTITVYVGDPLPADTPISTVR
ncbi:MAG: 1-acyl-sn-glycerol-3-phosphate acyltransferase, partial [Rhodopirellula sp. JB055]|uniref:1-acyl-sn-glycerol-3-phosphate acyltransferase n=1 Tax=Rhodopirellula sp. JB055 TaxID=3342846 RepID=UPI003709E459